MTDKLQTLRPQLVIPLDPEMALAKYAKNEDVAHLIKTIIEAIDNLKQTLSANIASKNNEWQSGYENAFQNLSHAVNQLRDIDNRISLAVSGAKAELKTEIDAIKDSIPVLPDFQGMIDKVKIPTIEEIENDLPLLGARIRDGLEGLEGDERLDAKYIKGLEDLEKRMLQRISDIPRGGGMSQIALQHAMGKLIKHQRFSTGASTTTVTLSDKVAGNVVCWVRYNGQMLQHTTHYTISGTTITFTFTLDDASYIEVTYLAA